MTLGKSMEGFQGYLNNIKDNKQRDKLEGIFNYIEEKFPHLTKEIKWNQPMFTYQGTFIIGFSVSKNHIAIAPEKIALDTFEADINESGYERAKEIFRIKCSDQVDLLLIERIIDYNIEENKGYNKFWR